MLHKPLAEPIDRGLRVFTCGHSFHLWTAELIAECAASAGIVGHEIAGTSGIGASQAIQHWDVPLVDNHAREKLRLGEVDVLTLSCMTYPDEGIANFARWAFAHNPDARVLLQELWLPEDRFPFDAKNRVRTSREQFDESTYDDLNRANAAYRDEMENYVLALNEQIGSRVVYIVPDGQAVLALRRLIIEGDTPALMPALAKQSDLFADPWGHALPPLKALAGYCQFAAVYRRSPIGLPAPAILNENPLWTDALSTLLQELAWEAVANHPMSGVS